MTFKRKSILKKIDTNQMTTQTNYTDHYDNMSKKIYEIRELLLLSSGNTLEFLCKEFNRLSKNYTLEFNSKMRDLNLSYRMKIVYAYTVVRNETELTIIFKEFD